MESTDPRVTTDTIDAIGDKLGAAFDSLTDEEREIFSLVVGGGAAEVSGFANMSLGMETLRGLDSAGVAAGGGSADAVRRPLSWFRSCRYEQCCQPGGRNA